MCEGCGSVPAPKSLINGPRVDFRDLKSFACELLFILWREKVEFGSQLVTSDQRLKSCKKLREKERENSQRERGTENLKLATGLALLALSVN